MMVAGMSSSARPAARPARVHGRGGQTRRKLVTNGIRACGGQRFDRAGPPIGGSELADRAPQAVEQGEGRIPAQRGNVAARRILYAH